MNPVKLAISNRWYIHAQLFRSKGMEQSTQGAFYVVTGGSDERCQRQLNRYNRAMRLCLYYSQKYLQEAKDGV